MSRVRQVIILESRNEVELIALYYGRNAQAPKRDRRNAAG